MQSGLVIGLWCSFGYWAVRAVFDLTGELEGPNRYDFAVVCLFPIVGIILGGLFS